VKIREVETVGHYLEIFALPALGAVAIAYLLGSVSSSIIFTKLFCNNTDIRSMGSGNAGMTNVLRSVGAKAAVFTSILDFAKCAVAALIGRTIFQYVCTANAAPAYFIQYGAFLAGLACVLGHIYPVYFGFRGGKGILSTSALMLVLDWRIFVIAISVFVVTLLITKIISISSILAAASFPISTFFTSYYDYTTRSSGYGVLPASYVAVMTTVAFLFAVILIWKHRANIKRLKNGTEKKVSVKHKQA
jgi:glycerol-3-phosphate acyltransferase PlsY